ncbi:MAG: tetratricopeptide repeat protein, partial [candidate division WOR-3 bacterium]
KEIGDRAGESACYGNLGNVYDSLGEFHKAIEDYEKALEICEAIGDKFGEIIARINLGLTLFDKDKKKAKEEGRKAKELIKELKIENSPSGKRFLAFIEKIYKEQVTEETKREFTLFSLRLRQ